MNETLKAIALEDVCSEELFDAVDGYKGKGYGLTTQNDLGKTETQPNSVPAFMPCNTSFNFCSLMVFWLIW